MSQYIIRLDDASDYMDFKKWIHMEKLLDKHEIKPIFGIIPKNMDDSLTSKYKQNLNFWDLINQWIKKGWMPAMHGYEHRYITNNSGINPVNKKSEFAGLPYEKQAKKIRDGYKILSEHGITPNIFFAPSHTFDKNTLKAVRIETPIRIICDTIAWNTYKNDSFWFIPQQSGTARRLPFKIVTFCYHPNNMEKSDFELLDRFIYKYHSKFIDVNSLILSNRRFSIIDSLLRFLYFSRRLIEKNKL